MRRHYSWVILVSLALSAVACDDDASPPIATARLELKNFESCPALEAYIEETAIRQVNAALDQQKQAYNNPDDGWFGGPEPAMRDAGGMEGSTEAGAPSADSSGSPAAHTTTNDQVAGVHEPDIVKNDGTRIFVLSGNRLYAATSWPPSDLALAGQVEIEGSPRQMLLDAARNRVVVFSTVYVDGGGAWWGGGGDVMPMMDMAYCDGLYGCGYGGLPITKITVVDIADLAEPRVLSDTYLPGDYAQARQVGASIRVVLRDDLRWPEGIQWYPDSYGANEADFAAAIERAKTENRELIHAHALADWLPEGKRTLADGSEVDLTYACTDFYYPTAPVRLGLLTVVTLNLENPEAMSRLSVLGEVGQIYASAESLYVASSHWWWWPEPGQEDYSYLHKFDIADADVTTYVASGGVKGHILNQFSLDEHEGYLRIATTRRGSSGGLFRSGPETTTNAVSVLGEDEGNLEVVGEVTGLGPDEQIYSARFIGDRGFVVTFRQIDPLYTLDLSNPRAPRVVGELKIPGYSSYIHPLGENHILTIGEHLPDPADGGSMWEERRVKLSIFDVSDFANPKEAFTYLIGTASGYSEATYEHKAFNYFPERKLLAIPFYDYSASTSSDYWGSFHSELKVFDVDAETGISERGALSLSDVYQTVNRCSWGWGYNPWVTRSVMATDDGGIDYVYAISDAGIRVARATALSSPVETLVFPVEGAPAGMSCGEAYY